MGRQDVVTPDSGSARGGWRAGWRGLVLGIVGAAVAAFAYAAMFAGGGVRGETVDLPPAPPAALQPSAPVEVVSVDTLGPGEGLGSILRRNGLEGREFLSVVEEIREFQSPRRMPPGLTVQIASRVPERISRIVLGLDGDRSLHVVRGRDGWRSQLDSVPIAMDTLRVAGVIESSLWGARLFGDTARLVPNEDNEIIVRLSQIYAWQVDFFRDIRPGDAFRVLIERELRPDGSLRRARVLAAEFFNGDRRLSAVRFVPPDGPVEYYDEEGEATRKAFLRAPLRFGRRTSGYSRRRFHPVLRRYRAHRGVDYGAPRGTPVMATGGGVVTRAGWWNGYGRVVEIRHTLRFRTRYAHLTDIADGVRSGARVQQKEVIGYVGSTGLATGPHVHYEFLVNGSQRNPSTVELPPGDPVPAAQRDEFRAVRDERLALLRDLSMPADVRLARGEEGESAGGAADP